MKKEIFKKKHFEPIALDDYDAKFLKISKHATHYMKALKKKAFIHYVFWVVFSSLIFVLNIVLIVLASFTLAIITRNGGLNESLNIALSALVAFFIIILFVLSSVLAIFKANSKYTNYLKASEELEYVLIRVNNDETIDKKYIQQALLNINSFYSKKRKLQVKKVLKSFLIGDKYEGNDE